MMTMINHAEGDMTSLPGINTLSLNGIIMLPSLVTRRFPDMQKSSSVFVIL